MSFRGEQVIKGTTYVFEAIAQWDAEKQQSRQKRIYIGKKDPVTGAFLPNKKYYELYGEDAEHTLLELFISLPKIEKAFVVSNLTSKENTTTGSS